jgi:hypothetical protein
VLLFQSLVWAPTSLSSMGEAEGHGCGAGQTGGGPVKAEVHGLGVGQTACVGHVEVNVQDCGAGQTAFGGNFGLNVK